MKVEQSESRKLLWYGVEEKWPGKMTFSGSAERRLKSCSLRVAWPGLSSGRIFANSPCLPGSRMCMSVYICRHRLRCCSLLLLKSCCEVCHHREAEWFVCLPQLFFPMLQSVIGHFISRFRQSPGGKLSVAQARLKFLKFAFASGLAYLMCAP